MKRGNHDDSFSIHPLVHSWARLRLRSEPQKEIEKAMEAFEIISSGVVSSDKRRTEDWIFEQQVMPHIDAVTKHATQYLAVGNTKVHGGANSLGDVYWRRGWYGKAMEWYGRALAGREKALGVDHPDTLTTVHNMASVYKSQGQYDKALEWYGRALAGREKSIGTNHPRTQTTIRRLVGLYERSGRIEQARSLRTRLQAATSPSN